MLGLGFNITFALAAPQPIVASSCCSHASVGTVLHRAESHDNGRCSAAAAAERHPGGPGPQWHSCTQQHLACWLSQRLKTETLAYQLLPAQEDRVLWPLPPAMTQVHCVDILQGFPGLHEAAGPS